MKCRPGKDAEVLVAKTVPNTCSVDAFGRISSLSVPRSVSPAESRVSSSTFTI